MRIHSLHKRPVQNFHEFFAIQLNDTHPSIAVAELMRLLLDDSWSGLGYAWNITQKPWHTPITRCCPRLSKVAAAAFRQASAAASGNHLRDQCRFLDEVRAKYPR